MYEFTCRKDDLKWLAANVKNPLFGYLYARSNTDHTAVLRKKSDGWGDPFHTWIPAEEILKVQDKV